LSNLFFTAYTRDFNKAHLILFHEAGNGVARAQLLLGKMYRDANGVLQDYMTAHMWFNLSASNGDEEAAKSLSDITKLMTPTMISKAQHLAREFDKIIKKSSNEKIQQVKIKSPPFKLDRSQNSYTKLKEDCSYILRETFFLWEFIR
jgi:TPR repeat protein